MEPLSLRGLQRQVAGEDTVPELGIWAQDDLVRLGKFLDIVCTYDQRIVEKLDRADLQHAQDDLAVLRAVLVPAVAEGFRGSSEGTE